MSLNPFGPAANQSATSIAYSTTPATFQLGPNSPQAYLAAIGTNAWVTVGDSSSISASVSSSGTPTAGMMLIGSLPRVISLRPKGWVSVIASTAGGSGQLYATPGEGTN